MTPSEYRKQPQSYRMGFVEGQEGVRDAYLLQTGCTDIEEYERGFADGVASLLTAEPAPSAAPSSPSPPSSAG